MRKRILWISLGLGLLLSMTGCANMRTSTSQFKNADIKLQNRDYAGLIAQIEAAKEKQYKQKDRVLYYLDLGTLYYYAGNYAKSNEMLSAAEQAIEENYTKSISKAAVSMLLNDNTLDYGGEDYEDIYINVFKALNFLALDKFDDAFVEIRRINIKLGVLEDKYQKMAAEMNKSKDKGAEVEVATNHFHNDALGRYLSMLLYRTEGKLDDARIDKDKIAEAFELQKNIYNFTSPTLDKVLQTDPGMVKVNILGMIGQSPVKKAKVLALTTFKDEIWITGNEPDKFDARIFWPSVEEGYHFKLSLPYMFRKGSNITKINVLIDGKPMGELQKIEDVGNVAVETFKLKEPLIYAKGLARTIVKGIASEKAKAKMKNSNPGLGGALMGLATDIAVDATENADLRISRFFPNEFQIGEFEVAPGKHTVELEYYNAANLKLFSESLGEQDFNGTGLHLIRTAVLR